MIETKLREIEERCKKATPGPWESFVEGRDFTSGSSFIRTESDDIELLGATSEDQDFIAHAREDVPFLLDEIRRLQKLLG